ncbi:ribitol-5-phosphate xylosyltransferase 1-like isoform X2 [Bacillus rossius redtenbacheri]|uniref:ribitol-5-phosphate xylosyltransferase 1-like isoform X2 n=1 Tax=Bacillus rossius redtenbacheri TaxID=93214 RepID=UPI002FDE53BA
MKISWKGFVFCFSVVYVTTIIAVYKFYFESAALLDKTTLSQNVRAPFAVHLSHAAVVNQSSPSSHTVEIWSKASLGNYLWKHILNGEIQVLQNGLVEYGELTLKNIIIKYRTGPGIIQTTVPSDVRYLVIALNGRSADKITTAKSWLNYLHQYRNLRGVIVVLLGDEACNNNWLLPYMQSRGGAVNAAFIVYDSSLVDNEEIFQWPLGVAVYRKFPNTSPKDVDVSLSRPYLCNFLGTVYKHSSREKLIEVLNSSSFNGKCMVRGRKIWQPLETEESLGLYIGSLLKSDLTLSPVGMNTECYRIYEALSLGSIPVIEDKVTPGICDGTSSNSPLRLLKSHYAPVIFLKNWHELPAVLSQEMQLTLDEKVERRRAVIEWYKNFKQTMKIKFINVLNMKFFPNN